MKTRVHGIRWYNLEAKAIHHMSLNEFDQLAVARCDKSIEIWSMAKASYLDRVIYLGKDASIEALVWCKNRLFSTGLNGLIVEYDLIGLKEKASIATSLGGCWCMMPSPNEQFLAVGTEAGFVCVYDVGEEKVSFLKSFIKQEGRVICLNWHVSGNYIVTGSLNSLKLWDTNKGITIHKMNVQTDNLESIVLCVAITNDMQIISGDSTGKVMFWNGLKGLLLQSIKIHKAEILCMALVDENNGPECYVSGVDPQIVKFRRNPTSNREWKKDVAFRKMHTHDVRCLLAEGNYLISGGVDSYLTVTKYPPNVTVKYPPVLPTSYISVASSVQLVLLQYANHLELWKLGSTQENSEVEKCLALSSEPLLLLRLQACDDETIVCSAISTDAKWLVYSTNNTLKVYRITLKHLSSDKPYVSLKKLKSILKDIGTAVSLRFISDCNKFAALQHCGKLQIFQIEESRFSLFFEFPSTESSSGSHLLSVSDNGEYAAAANHDGFVSIFSLTDSLTKPYTLPQCSVQATAIEFVPNLPFLLIAYQNRTIYEFDLKSRKFSKSLGKLMLGNHLTHKSTPEMCFRGITFIPGGDQSFILYDDQTVYHVNKQEIVHDDVRYGDLPKGVKSISLYKHLIHFTHLQEDFMVALEVTPESFQQQLPPTLVQKRFGT